jgi:hypothetical protein
MDTVLEVKILRRKLKHGDYKRIAEISGMSPASVTQVIRGVWYNKTVVEAAKQIIAARENKN